MLIIGQVQTIFEVKNMFQGRFTGMKLKTFEKLQNLSHIVTNFPIKIATLPYFLLPIIRHFFHTPPLWWFLGRLYPPLYKGGGGDHTMRHLTLFWIFFINCFCAWKRLISAEKTFPDSLHYKKSLVPWFLIRQLKILKIKVFLSLTWWRRGLCPIWRWRYSV